MLNAQEADFYLETLKSLASLPTASFHEELVCQTIVSFLQKYNIPYEIDRYGNIIAHYQKGAACRPLALMAHTDHPAFELIEPNTNPEFAADWRAKLLGGVTAEYFAEPFRVKVFPANDVKRPVGATVVGYKTAGGPRDIDLYLKLDEPNAALQPSNFGIWDLTDFELRNGFIHARVMDDLVGCAAALLALWKVAQTGTATNLYGVFTRAEEVGLVGAAAIFADKLLPAEAFVVSLEASRTLPGAIQGEGPVIRVGDRGFTFSEEAEFILKQAETSLKTQYGGQLKVQRQLMSGGRCEASAAILAGYTATGLAFPLGNYHNMGANGQLEPENIHLEDYLTGVLLLQEAARLMPQLESLVAGQKAKETNPTALIERLLATRPAL